MQLGPNAQRDVQDSSKSASGSELKNVRHASSRSAFISISGVVGQLA